MEDAGNAKKAMGFAVLKTRNRPRLLEIASMGGKAAINRHKWTSEEAALAGKKGGATMRRRKTVKSLTFSEGQWKI
jgi:general stress protein YciG